MSIPLIGNYFRAMGVLPAAPDSIATALAEGRDVALWPGGEVDSLRPWRERDRATLAGWTGFVKMAIRAGVPIVPIATVGGANAMPVPDPRRQALPSAAAGSAAAAEGLPGGGVAAVGDRAGGLASAAASGQDPHDAARADDGEYVDAVYREVEASIQTGLDALARKRALPLFG